MRPSKWLLICFTLGLCTLAAGIGIGLALPHVGTHRDGSEFFQRLADETAPDKTGDTRQGVLAARFRKKFTVQVIRSAPEVNVGSDGFTTNFTAVIMGRGPGGLDGQALLREIEEYLKELAGAAKSEGVKTFTENRSENGKEVVVQWIRFGSNEISTYDREIQGKKVGFVFRYRTPAEVYGEIVVDLYNERTTTQGAIWGLVAVSMDVREQLSLVAR